MSTFMPSQIAHPRKRKRSEMQKSILVTEADQLGDILRHRGPATIKLLFTPPANIDKDAWERTFNVEKNACGCDYGALFALLSLIGFAAVVYLYWPTVQTHNVASVLVASLAWIASIGCGKLIGQWQAKRRLRSAVRALRLELSTLQPSHDIRA